MTFFWRFFVIIFAVFSPFSACGEGVSYTVDFEGIDNSAALKSIKSASQLTSLKKRPPASVNALRYRAESDIPEIVKILHSYGYYEAVVHVRLQDVTDKIRVVVNINPGPVYNIQTFDIRLYSGSHGNLIVCQQITPFSIGIEIGKPISAQSVLQAELKLLQLLSECGYPLASIEKREIIANGEKKTVSISLDVQVGEFSRFGSTSFKGLTSVKPLFIQRKLKWAENEIYNSRLVEQTQNAILDTHLFSSVLITHTDELCPDGTLPMTIEVVESKHRSVNFGASYQTVFGPGVTLGWENRNVGGMGRKLSIQGDFTRISHSGLAVYHIPDFLRVGQDFIWQAQAMHEAITAYSQRTYNLGNRLERNWGTRFRYSIGGKVERLYVTNSIHNGNFLLVEVPFYLRWSNANSLLNPTRGFTVEYKMVPSINLTDTADYYLYQEIRQSVYLPVTDSHSVSLAQKITFGSILSQFLNAVPVSKRFLGGSEEELRGYKYKTVSPLKNKRKPIGGRSAIYYTLESRFRLSQSLGLVPFFDMGYVTLKSFPDFHGKWFKSVGLGIRYFSFIGPLRLDIGFPLDRRKRLDRPYRILVSIGQMF
jgi:translocation and assembly module TamA